MCAGVGSGADGRGGLLGEVVGGGELEGGVLVGGPGGGGRGRGRGLVFGQAAGFGAVGGGVGLAVAGQAVGGGPVDFLGHCCGWGWVLCVCDGVGEVR